MNNEMIAQMITESENRTRELIVESEKRTNELIVISTQRTNELLSALTGQDEELSEKTKQETLEGEYSKGVARAREKFNAKKEEEERSQRPSPPFIPCM